MILTAMPLNCQHCDRPIAGIPTTINSHPYHYECTRSPYAELAKPQPTSQDALEPDECIEYINKLEDAIKIANDYASVVMDNYVAKLFERTLASRPANLDKILGAETIIEQQATIKTMRGCPSTN